MLRLGSILLSGVLLGVPRALDAPAFGAQRSVYVEVSPQSPDLVGLARAIERKLGDAAYRLADRRTAATTVVEVLHASRSIDGRGRSVEAFTVSVREGRRARRLVLHAPADCRDEAAAALLSALAGPRES